jgi:hypothetical protein
MALLEYVEEHPPVMSLPGMVSVVETLVLSAPGVSTPGTHVHPQWGQCWCGLPRTFCLSVFALRCWDKGRRE